MSVWETTKKQELITIFRALVFTSTALYVLLWLLPYFYYGSYSFESQALLRQDGRDAVWSLPDWAFWLLFFITVGVSASLFFFVPFARRAYLLLIVFYSVITFWCGLRVSTPADEFIGGLIAMSDGALLAMLYFTPIADRFSESANSCGHIE